MGPMQKCSHCQVGQHTTCIHVYEATELAHNVKVAVNSVSFLLYILYCKICQDLANWMSVAAVYVNVDGTDSALKAYAIIVDTTK